MKLRSVRLLQWIDEYDCYLWSQKLSPVSRYVAAGHDVPSSRNDATRQGAGTDDRSDGRNCIVKSHTVVDGRFTSGLNGSTWFKLILSTRSF